MPNISFIRVFVKFDLDILIWKGIRNIATTKHATEILLGRNYGQKKKKTFKVEHCEMKVPYKQTQN